MNWAEFLQKVRTYKKEYETGQVDLRAGSLVTLLFAGAFDSMLDKPNPTVFEYRQLSQELLDALGSKAKLPEAKKTEVIGIADIQSEFQLHLWRSEMNPVYRFDFAPLLHTFLTTKGFLKRGEVGDVSYRKPEEPAPPGSQKRGKPEILVFRQLDPIYSKKDKEYKRLHQENGNCLVGLVGVVNDFRIRMTKKNREMGVFRLFTGDGLSYPIYLWPRRGEDIVPYAVAKDLKNGTAGLAIVRPGEWNDNRNFHLVGWLPSNEKAGG